MATGTIFVLWCNGDGKNRFSDSSCKMSETLKEALSMEIKYACIMNDL